MPRGFRRTFPTKSLRGKDVERWNMTVAFRLGRFGNSQADLILQDRIVCPLIEMPDRVIETLHSKYLVSPIHYEGLQRKEPLEIPEDGLREMLCNSLIHKDYTGTFIQMKVFDDHITLWNGGSLPPGYTVEKLMEPHESHPSEKFIAIQAKGSDVENGKDVVDVVIDNVVEKLSERQVVIYKIIRKSVVDGVVETASSIASKIMQEQDLSRPLLTQSSPLSFSPVSASVPSSCAPRNLGAFPSQSGYRQLQAFESFSNIDIPRQEKQSFFL